MWMEKLQNPVRQSEERGEGTHSDERGNKKQRDEEE
jgi:hypothetical protein